MAFWARQARRLPFGRGIFASGKQRSPQVSCLSHFILAPEECRQQFIGFSRSNTELGAMGAIRREALGFCRNEEQNLGFCTHGRELVGSGGNGELYLGLGRELPCLLGFASESKEGSDPLGFCKVKASRRSADASLIMSFSALALLLSTELSHAEDLDLNLRPQPDAKSNIHTAKWRIFTDKARDLCGQGSFDNAEKFFYKALEEAKLGFGEEDPHVASCYNNLAELFRMKREYDKAEPLYLEAVNRLRQSSGVEDGSVGFALHNLGGFYLLQRKIEQARGCYEEALKIKGRALGLDHPEYANTMFHLGEVIRLQGDVNDGLALIRDSIRILEQVGLGNTSLAVKRSTRLSELLVLSGQLAEAEAVQRKILQVLEFSTDFQPKDTAAALENLSATLQKQGKVDECEALLEQSISIRRKSNGDDDMHMAASLLKLGEISFQRGKNAISKQDNLHALASYDKAEGLLLEAVKMAELHHKEGSARQGRSSAHGNAIAAPVLLAHCLATLGDLRVHKLDILDILVDKELSWEICMHTEVVLRRAISYLEDILVQQGDKASSDVRKLYKECSRNLADLNKKKLKLQSRSQGHA